MEEIKEKVEGGVSTLEIFFTIMYLFPRAAVTKYQKLGGLKQYMFIVS